MSRALKDCLQVADSYQHPAIQFLDNKAPQAIFGVLLQDETKHHIIRFAPVFIEQTIELTYLPQALLPPTKNRPPFLTGLHHKIAAVSIFSAEDGRD